MQHMSRIDGNYVLRKYWPTNLRSKVSMKAKKLLGATFDHSGTSTILITINYEFVQTIMRSVNSLPFFTTVCSEIKIFAKNKEL